jgi:hypothetical protein
MVSVRRLGFLSAAENRASKTRRKAEKEKK